MQVFILGNGVQTAKQANGIQTTLPASEINQFEPENVKKECLWIQRGFS